MQFTYVQGGPLPAPQPMEVRSVDAVTGAASSEPVNVVLSDTATWLKVDPTAGSTPYAITVSVMPQGLAPGSYTAGITIEHTDVAIVNPNDVEPVGLTIYAAGIEPEPEPEPPRISFKTADNSTFKNNNQEFQVIVADDVGVTTVELYVGEPPELVAVQSVHKDGQKMPSIVQLQWMESTIPKGTYLLTAKAYNKAGGMAQAQIHVKRV